MAKFVYVDGDDWKGIFKDGKLVSEGHDFHAEHLMKILGVDCEVKFADLEWLGDKGNFPEKLEDVKFHA